MKSEYRYQFVPAKHPVLRWLVDPGSHVPSHIRDPLLSELFGTPGSVIAGVLNGLVVNVVAVLLHAGHIFTMLMVADLIIGVLRVAVVSRLIGIRDRGGETPTDFYLATGIFWCGMQGAIAFATMRTSLQVLQILGAITAVGLVGPICARNFPAPRYAMLLICLCDVPFVTSAALSGNPWLLILLLLTVPFLYGSYATLARFQSLAVGILLARHDSSHQARHDPLTGLLNRFGLMEMISRPDRAATSALSLFYLDLDGFKQVNDTHGHPAGDALLIAVAERLRQIIRGADMVARMGGDEFVLIAPGLPPSGAAAMAERLVRQVTAAPYELDGVGTVRIGVSVGYACAPEDSIELSDLYRQADTALYDAKRNAKGTPRRFTTLQKASAA